MSEFDDFINMNTAEAESKIGTSFIYKGKTYKGFYSTIKEMSELQDGGFLQRYVSSLSVQKSALYNLTFKKLDLLTLKNRTYRIKEIEDDEFFYVLELGDPKE